MGPTPPPGPSRPGVPASGVTVQYPIINRAPCAQLLGKETASWDFALLSFKPWHCAAYHAPGSGGALRVPAMCPPAALVLTRLSASGLMGRRPAGPDSPCGPLMPVGPGCMATVLMRCHPTCIVTFPAQSLVYMAASVDLPRNQASQLWGRSRRTRALAGAAIIVNRKVAHGGMFSARGYRYA